MRHEGMGLRFAVLVTILALIAAAALTVFAPVRASASDLAAVSGTVVDQVTKLPLANVKVMTLEYDEGDTHAVQALWTKTDSEGKFRLSTWKQYAIVYFHGQIYPGVVTHESQYYPSSRLENPLWCGDWPRSISRLLDSWEVGAATKIRRVEGQCADLGTIELRPKPMPHGLITGSAMERFSGAPIKGSVSVWKQDDSGAWVNTGLTTQIDGDYALFGTTETPVTDGVRLHFQGSYGGAIYYPDSATVDQALSLTLDANQSVHGVNVSIPIMGKIMGRVVNVETGEGVPNARMNHVNWSERWQSFYYYANYGDHWTDSEGYYVIGQYFGGQPPGRYKVYVQLRPRPYTSGVDYVWYGGLQGGGSGEGAWEVILPPGGVVKDIDIFVGDRTELDGQLLAPDGEGSPDIAVAAYRRTSTGWTRVASGFTDAEGKYRIGVPSGGTYTLLYRDTGGTSQTGDDAVTYLGGARSLSVAKTIYVKPSAPRRVSPQRIRTTSKPRAKRIRARGTVDTANALSESVFSTGTVQAVVLVSKDRPADALCSAGLAGTVKGTVLFTESRCIPRTTLLEIQRLGVKKVYVVGDRTAVSYTQDELLRALGMSVKRLWGADMYGVSARVASEIATLTGIPGNKPVFVVNPASLSDALVVGPVAYDRAAPIVYTKSVGMPAVVKGTLANLGVARVQVVGGAVEVPDRVLISLSANGITPTRLAGDKDRNIRAAQFANAAQRRGWTQADTVGIASVRDFRTAIGSASMLGRKDGVVLFGSADSLPVGTVNALKSRSASIDSIDVLASPDGIRARTLISAGSQ